MRVRDRLRPRPLALVALPVIAAATGCGLLPASTGAPMAEAMPGTTSSAPVRTEAPDDAPTTPTTTGPAAPATSSVATAAPVAGRTTRPPATTTTTTRRTTSPTGRTTTGPATSTGALLTLGPPTESALEAEVVRLVNVEREEAGCSDAAVSGTLVQVARAHSKEMTAPGGFKHNSPDGRTPFQRMTAAGYQYLYAAENIAAGQPTAAAVVAAWMGSEGHRANIVDCRFTEIGVGVVQQAGTQYGTYWTQEFATPLAAAPSN